MTISDPCTVRPMKATDSARLAQIDLHAFSVPWDQSDFEAWHRRTLYTPRRSHAAVVVCSITGFTVGHATWQTSTRHVSLIECVTDAPWRRNGYGAEILKHIAGTLTRRMNKIFVLCHVHNLDGQAFLSACGFHSTGLEAVGGVGSARNHHRMQYVHAATLPVSVVDGVTIPR